MFRGFLDGLYFSVVLLLITTPAPVIKQEQVKTQSRKWNPEFSYVLRSNELHVSGSSFRDMPCHPFLSDR